MTYSTEEPAVALSIAGSDSGGGAGIQADLKAMTHRGVHGCTALTALTAQNSTGVQDIHPVPAEFLREQIQSVTSDFEVAATKTGMLFNGGNIEVVAEEAGQLGSLVVDPVMVAESGDPLMEPEAERTLVEDLLPRADLVTPNWTEAEQIAKRLGVSLSQSPGELGRSVAEALEGPGVLVKGGHLDEDRAVDRLVFPDGTEREYVAERIDTINTHGSGCVYSSLIAAELARDSDLADAIETAKEILTETLRDSYATGSGPGTLNMLQTGEE